MRKSLALCMAVSALLASSCASPGAAWKKRAQFFREPATLDDPGALRRDTKAMWETQEINGQTWSTERAVAAARRVFATVDLKGKTHDEVAETLGRRPSRSSTNSQTTLYSFETRTHGFGVKLIYDARGRVVSVWFENII